MVYSILRVRNYFEVRDRFGRFLFSADSYREAVKEAELLFAA